MSFALISFGNLPNYLICFSELGDIYKKGVRGRENLQKGEEVEEKLKLYRREKRLKKYEGEYIQNLDGTEIGYQS